MKKKVAFILMWIAMISLVACSANEKQDGSNNQGVLTTGSEIGVDRERERNPATMLTGDTLKVSGNVQVLDYEEIYLGIPAKVEAINVKVGDAVNKGSELISFSDDSYALAIRQKEREVKSLQVDIQKLEASVSPLTAELSAIQSEIRLRKSYEMENTNPDIQTLQGNLEVEKENLKAETEKYNMTKELLKANLASSKEVKDLQQSMETIQNKIKGIKNSIATTKIQNKLTLESLESKLKSLNSQIDSNDTNNAFDLESKKIAQEEAQDQLDLLNKKLRQPHIKGQSVISTKDDMLVAEVNCAAGKLLEDDNKEVLMKLMDRNSAYIQVKVPIENCSLVKVGDKAEINDYSYVNDIQGEVESIDNIVTDVEGDTVKVNIKVLSGKNLLRPGADIEAIIHIHKGQ